MTTDYNANIRKFEAKTWSQVVEDFEAEMLLERKRLGMKPWESFVLYKEQEREKERKSLSVQSELTQQESKTIHGGPLAKEAPISPDYGKEEIPTS